MSELDQLIHQPVRLRIMAVLAGLAADAQLDFVYLRNLLTVTDGNLGAHLVRLEEARYIRIKKTFIKRKPRTFVAITGRGRDAFASHCKALQDILQQPN